MILIDTSILVSYVVEQDINHSKAKEIMTEITSNKFGKPILTDYIFDETVTVVLVRSKSLKKATLIGNLLKTSVEFAYVDDVVFERGWKLFETQKDSKLSFTDCTTIASAELNGIDYIATFDQEFKGVKGAKVVPR